MEQHAVPQHIASFEFKLFGNLTVRQFVTLAIPMSVAAIIFFSNVTPIIRLPLSFVFGLFGIFAALVPVGGRPFDKWIVAFIKAVTSPTQRVWIKEERLPEFLNVVVSPPSKEEKIPESVTIQGKARLSAYLRSLPQKNASPLDVREQLAIQRLDLPENVAQGQTQQPAIIWTQANYQQLAAQTSAPVTTKLVAQTVASEYQGQFQEALPSLETPRQIRSIPRINPQAKAFILPGLEKKLGKGDASFAAVELVRGEAHPQPKARLASETNFSIENIIPIHAAGQIVKLFHGIGKTRVRKLHFAPPTNFDLDKLPIRGERTFDISEELKTRFQFEQQPQELVQPVTIQPIIRKEPEATPRRKSVSAPKPSPKPKVKVVTKQQKITKAKQQSKYQAPSGLSIKTEKKEALDSKVSFTRKAKKGEDPGFSQIQRASIVPLTDKPNVLSGLVSDINETPVEGAILTVHDQDGVPVRALKTNKLGQFLSATSLPDGKYTIDVDTKLAKFREVTINLNGQVLSPLEIKGGATASG